MANLKLCAGFALRIRFPRSIIPPHVHRGVLLSVKGLASSAPGLHPEGIRPSPPRTRLFLRLLQIRPPHIQTAYAWIPYIEVCSTAYFQAQGGFEAALDDS